MIFQLKQYQERCLDDLTAFFQRTRKLEEAKLAFYDVTERPYRDVEELPGLPYVCLRVPTGGGKTVMASHAIGRAASQLLLVERCLVLWLAPTTQIVSQTIEALRDRHHPYRQALDESFSGSVTVLDMPSALSVKPAALSADTTVIVSTIQAPRVGDREGRKIYAEDNGQLMDHFEGLAPEQLAALDMMASGKPARSLANVFKLHRPVIIVDEAHNARTPLSFETLARFNPSCIVEFTATPAKDSNVLTHVSAAELKAEEMIKLPVRLRTRPQWKEAIQEALAMQAELEEAAKQELDTTQEYIRPIVLLQAQRKGKGHITFDLLKQSLVDDFRVPEEQILIATGEKNELKGENVLLPDCPVRFIITVDKLREGWDCPFAYVLCSVSNLTSSTAVEQIMGRVLRMPHAKRKKADALNHAYAFVTSQGFVEAANALTDALVQSGFNPYEARQSIKPAEQIGLLPTDTLFREVTEEVSVVPDADGIPRDLRKHLKIMPSESGGATISYMGPPIQADRETEWKGAFAAEDDRSAIERLARKSRGEDAWPAATGEVLSVPALCIRIDDQLELFEDQFREGPWRLSDCDPAITDHEFSLPTGEETGADIDVKNGKITWRPFTETLQHQLSFLDVHGPRTEADLVAWLDRNIDHAFTTQMDTCLYFRKVLEHLGKDRGLPFEDLARNRFRLRDALQDKVNSLRASSAQRAFQQMLSPEAGTPLEVSPDVCFTFPSDQYPARELFEGPPEFNKHYYDVPAAMNPEEAHCAVVIDSLREVQYWVRNLDRDRYAFWLPTSTDKFWPDFVVKLKDGRFLVVEYKGAHLMGPETTEKEQIGQIWEACSQGACIFRLITKSNVDTELAATVRQPG